jgi:hypothetical protein
MLVRELPLAIQDRAFTNESQLWYPVADGVANETMHNGVPPRSLPEFSATVTANGVPVNMVMMTVNGRTYPRQVGCHCRQAATAAGVCELCTLWVRFMAMHSSSAGQARLLSPCMHPL